MKKIIITLSLLALSCSVNAKQIPEFLELMGNAQQTLNDNTYDVPCDACDNTSAGHVFTAQEGIAAILDGPLEYMGRDLFPGSAQNRTCVFKSKSAYILYNNCMANKK